MSVAAAKAWLKANWRPASDASHQLPIFDGNSGDSSTQRQATRFAEITKWAVAEGYTADETQSACWQLVSDGLLYPAGDGEAYRRQNWPNHTAP
jgi:hypothetical protein